MKRTLNFGKIDYLGNGKKNCLVTVDIELRKKGGEKTFTIDPTTQERIYTGEATPEYIEFSATGTIWNHLKTDCYCGGQCLDIIAKYIKTPLFKEIFNIWNLYHLNGMHAGTPEQEKAIEEAEKNGLDFSDTSYKKYDFKLSEEERKTAKSRYDKICDYLKSVNLYEVNFNGLTVGRKYNDEPYKYGHDWIIQELPKEIIERITEIINNANN